MKTSLETIHFEPRTAAMHSDCGPKVARLAEWLQAHPGVEVTLTGYLDQAEAPLADAALRERRAVTVRDALVGAGVAPARIRTMASRNGTLRCADGADETCHLRNRRVEVIARPAD